MSTQGLSQAQLLTCGDADFDNNIKNMAVKELMGLISGLQKEMAKEQENFNGLSSALQGLKDRNSRQYKTISRDMVASQGRLTTLMNRSMKCFSQVNGFPASSVTGAHAPSSSAAGAATSGQPAKRIPAPKPPAAGGGTAAAATANGQSEFEKIHSKLRATRELNLAALPDKPPSVAPQSSSTAPGDSSTREVSYFTTNLDRQKSSSSIALGQKSNFDNSNGMSSSSTSAAAGSSSQGGMRRAQSREELYAIESKARGQKDTLMKQIGAAAAGRKGSTDDEAYDSMPTSSQWGLKGNSLLAQRLQRDEIEQNPALAPRNDPPQSSLPNGTSGGISVSIRSTSRENLSNIDPPMAKMQSRTGNNASGNKPSSSSSTSLSRATTTSVSLHPSVNPPAVASAPQPTDNSTTTTTAPAKTPIRKAEVAEPAKTTTKLTMSASSTSTQNTTSATTATASAAVAAAGATGEEEEFTDLDDMNTPRMNLIHWDPKPLLDDLYKIQLMEETAEDISHQFISMEGLMEKLPMNKKKSTLLKTWKRRFFKAQDGWVQYYETSNRDKPSETLQLMGGRIDDMGNRILGIDDGRGRCLMVRAPTDKEHGQWKMALESQTADNTKATYVQPVQKSVPHSSKRIVVIDMGSSAIRAGVLGEQECLPQVFFPSVVAVHKETGKKVVGAEAYHPDVRRCSTLFHPIRPSNKLDQGVMKKFNIDVAMMTAIFGKVFAELKVDPSHYMVMLSTPQTLSDSLRAGLMDALIGSLGVQGVCMVQQSLLALYSYRTTSGIIVDIGHRIEILPIYDGFVIESGVARCPYGSQKVIDSLKKALLETNFKFTSEVEMLLVRYIMEKSCYVPTNYADEETLFATQPGKLDKVVNLCNFRLPEGAYKSVGVGEGRFTSPEGFFNVDLWEMDYPTLHKLIFQAIQSCPMDNRRHMYRAVYLSGGVTMLPGFPERLLKELKRLAPPAVMVEVHAAPNRYHAAYLGACAVAGMPQFKDMAISKEEWRKEGARAFKKWQASPS